MSSLSIRNFTVCLSTGNKARQVVVLRELRDRVADHRQLWSAYRRSQMPHIIILVELAYSTGARFFRQLVQYNRGQNFRVVCNQSSRKVTEEVAPDRAIEIMLHGIPALAPKSARQSLSD